MNTNRTRKSSAGKIAGIIMIILGVIFVGFAMAPALVPGGVPTGPLEFGGKGIQDINALELLLGALIMIAGFAIRKFAQRHIAILAGGVIAVFILSIIAVLSSLNSTLTLTGIDVTVQYGESDQGYFGPAQQAFLITSGNLNGNLTVDEGSSFKISFLFSESSLEHGNDSISEIKAATAVSGFAFQVTSVSPALPIGFTPGRTVLITVSLNAPFYSARQSFPPQYCSHGEYLGPIDLMITTTNG